MAAVSNVIAGSASTILPTGTILLGMGGFGRVRRTPERELGTFSSEEVTLRQVGQAQMGQELVEPCRADP